MYPNNFAVKIFDSQVMDAPTTVGQHHNAHSVVLRIARAFTPEEAAGCVRHFMIQCRIQGLEVAGMLSELLTSNSANSVALYQRVWRSVITDFDFRCPSQYLSNAQPQELNFRFSFGALYMGGGRNYGPFLGPYYNTAPNI